jgi:hypothetical protein
VNHVDPTGLLPNMCLDIWTGDGSRNVCFGPIIPFDPFVPKDPPVPDTPPTSTPATKDCNFPAYAQLSDPQKALVDANTYNNDFSQAQKANFLNQTGALGHAGINLGVARLQPGAIPTDRLLFQAGTTKTFQDSISSAIDNNKFNRDTPLESKHPGMSTFGGRQRKTFNALQAGFGWDGAFVDIDRSNPSNGLLGFFGHIIELITPGKTDPFAVGKALGRKVVGYDCK